jgi:hypothetical protein
VRTISLVLFLTATTSLVLASPDMIGYSGAPGTQGACAGACHGNAGGTILVTGFPTSYVAGQTYTVTVGASGMSNFNASVRVGTGSQTAGTIAAGTNTATYSTGDEPNGVHLSTRDRDNGTFTWTAPNPPVGPVTLYMAGHQSGMSGPNTEVMLTAQSSAVGEQQRAEQPALSFALEPSVATRYVVFRVNSPSRAARIRVLDQAGRLVARLHVAAGADQSLAWSLADDRGQRLAPGTYWASLSSDGERLVRRFTVR